MPVGRRSASRPAFLHEQPKPLQFPNSIVNTQDESNGSLPRFFIPHVRLPDIPSDGPLLCEYLCCVYAHLALGLQYTNLYNTVFWFPQSQATYALKFHMIDPHLTMLLVTVISYRLLLSAVDEIGAAQFKGSFYWAMLVVRCIMCAGVVFLLAWSGYHVAIRYSWKYYLFIAYPVSVYVMLFFNEWGALGLLKNCLPSWQPERRSHWYSFESQKRFDVFQRMQHACQPTPERCREEVQLMSENFNYRLKHVIFHSMCSVYYSCFLPVCFAQNSLFYDVWWIGQYCMLVWLGLFLYRFTQCLPAAYLDTMHRCALHLGRWHRVEGRHTYAPYSPWSELQCWQKGAVVKHVRGLFKAEGVLVTAEPANPMHNKFYRLFHPPVLVITLLVVTTWALIAYLFVQLAMSVAWHDIIVLGLLLTTDFYVMFKITRDWIVLTRVYNYDVVCLQTKFATD